MCLCGRLKNFLANKPTSNVLWLNDNGHTGDPALDGLRYAAAHTPIDLTIINLDTNTANDSDDPRPRR